MTKYTHPVTARRHYTLPDGRTLPFEDTNRDVSFPKLDQDVGIFDVPDDCEAARAWRRVSGGMWSAFTRSRAYLEVPDGQGSTKIVRGLLSRATAAAIKAYDNSEGHERLPQMLIAIEVPTPSKRIGSDHGEAGRTKETSPTTGARGILMSTGPRGGLRLQSRVDKGRLQPVAELDEPFDSQFPYAAPHSTGRQR